MQDIKRCEKCYKIISTIDSADWYSHMRIKYCDTCREQVKKTQAAERNKRARARRKEEYKALVERVRNFEIENEILRARIQSEFDLNNAKG